MKTRTFSTRRGYTLTELLIGVSISVAIAGMGIWFMVEGSRSSMKTANTSINDLSQWSIFTAISVDSKIANGMTVYTSFTDEDMANNTKRVGVNKRGNVLILTRSFQKDKSKQSAFSQVTGYIYSPVSRTLQKFVYVVPADEQGAAPLTLEEILVKHRKDFSLTKVADDLEATTSGDPNGDGVFLVRQEGHSGVLTVQSVRGIGGNRIISKKLIDASFFIRG